MAPYLSRLVGFRGSISVVGKPGYAEYTNSQCDWYGVYSAFPGCLDRVTGATLFMDCVFVYWYCGSFSRKHLKKNPGLQFSPCQQTVVCGHGVVVEQVHASTAHYLVHLFKIPNALMRRNAF